MTNSLLVVEGAHDASFFGHLLNRRGYTRVELLSGVPELWSKLIPTKFPVDKDGRLGNIISFPNIYKDSDDNIFGVAVAGNDEKLIPELRACLESLSLNKLTGIGLVVDADRKTTLASRFQSYVDRLKQLNADAIAKGQPDFPLPVPVQPGVVVAGPPKTGIHIFPDNANPGTLETILLDCVAMNAPLLRRCADTVVKYADRKTPADNKHLKKLRGGAGREKAAAGVIANLLAPGASLAASLRSDAWLSGGAMSNPAVKAADAFLEALL